MKFSQFLKESNVIEEGLSTSHGKVEVAIRSLNLKYTVEDGSNTYKEFVLPNGYSIYSYNNGNVKLMKSGSKAPIDSVSTLDYSKTTKIVSDMLTKHLDDINAKVEKKTEQPKRAIV